MAPIKTKLKAVPTDSGQASDLAAAGRVLTYAADALRTLGETLDGEFTRAVATILAARGRVIVSGMASLVTSPARSRRLCRQLAPRRISFTRLKPAMAIWGRSPVRMFC